MIIEGKNACIEALKGEITLEKLLVLKDAPTANFGAAVKLARDKKITVQFVDRYALDRISKTGKHQGILAFSTEFQYSELEEITQKTEKERFILLLDGINDPHNFGAIIRVADCAGIDGIIIPRHRACSVNDTVVKTSSGAASHVKIAKVNNINDCIRDLKEDGYTVFCAEAGGSDIYKTNLKGDIAIVIGSEGEGVHALTKKLCDESIALPVLGKVNSLNASVAAGIVVYEAVRQRTYDQT